MSILDMYTRHRDIQTITCVLLYMLKLDSILINVYLRKKLKSLKCVIMNKKNKKKSQFHFYANFFFKKRGKDNREFD